jgi:hypothetical protein
VELGSKEKNVDDVVDQLLRDQDFLLAREVRHQIDELNQLLIQAHSRHLKVEVDVTNFNVMADGQVCHLTVKVFKEI